MRASWTRIDWYNWYFTDGYAFSYAKVFRRNMYKSCDIFDVSSLIIVMILSFIFMAFSFILQFRMSVLGWFFYCFFAICVCVCMCVCACVRVCVWVGGWGEGGGGGGGGGGEYSISENVNQIFSFLSVFSPANTQRDYNVAATSRCCSDVKTTLLRRCVFAGSALKGHSF